MIHKAEEENEVKEELKENDNQIEEIAEALAVKSFFATALQNFTMDREDVERHLKQFRQCLSLETEEKEVTTEAVNLWHEYESLTQQTSKELCEQLRLILEPTVSAKMKGDFKTGKRLNMKRVIEYIATEYRKDKIWLRRVKPSKRDYQVLLAIDNSSSMSDNHCVHLAYETVATLTSAFNYLEVGQFGLMSFGERVTQLHDLNDRFTSDSGAKIISQLDFKHERTKIAEMLNASIDLFKTGHSRVQKSASAVSKLLIVLSDGRGIFYEGMETVRAAVRESIQNGVFIVFLLLETPANKSSIFDIKMPIFTEGNPVNILFYYMF